MSKGAVTASLLALAVLAAFRLARVRSPVLHRSAVVRPATQPAPPDEPPPGGGGGEVGAALAVSPDETFAALADLDNHQVLLVSLRPGAESVTGHFTVGNAPAQLMFVGPGHLAVTERLGGTVSLYALPSGRRVRSIALASDPFGIARTPDGRAIAVTSTRPPRLTVLDAATLAVRCSVAVGREPRGALITPDGRRALVAHIAGEPLDAVELAGCTAVALPPIPMHSEETWATGQFGEVSLTAHPRPSQAWAMVADGARVWVPFMANRTGREVPPGLRKPVYGAGNVRPETPDKTSFALAAFDTAAWRWVDVWQPTSQQRVVAAPHLPMALARCADGSLRVASAGTDAVAVVVPRPHRSPTIAATVPTVDVPQAIACLTDARTLTYSPVSHALEVRERGQRRELATSAYPMPDQHYEGRILFYSALDPRISSGGLACAGCHPDGRDDGLTWFLRHGPRQTPTLEGRLVPPFNWNGTEPTVTDNLDRTINRLGGRGLPLEDFDALASYVEHGLATVPTVAVAATAAVARGREVFREADCASCHDPARRFTDGRSHALGGLRGDELIAAFDTPSLLGVRDTAPYFHDGRYPTLDALLRDPRHRMGDLAGVRADDRAALVAFLETL